MGGIFKVCLPIVVTAASLVFAAGAHAEVVALKADLSGQNEVPANNDSGSGLAEAVLDTSTMILSWTVSYENLTGPVIGAHIHGPAQPTENAGIAIGFQNPETSPITGEVELTEEQVEVLLSGRYYVNIHTAAHPGGEIRGHLLKAE